MVRPLAVVRNGTRYIQYRDLSDSAPGEEAIPARGHRVRMVASRDMILDRDAVTPSYLWEGVSEPENISGEYHLRYVVWGESERQPLIAPDIQIDEEVEADHDRDAALKQTFDELAENWHRETDHLSSINDIALNFNYQRIIGMGPNAIPMILEELQKDGGHWFWALRAITGEDPVDPVDRGDFPKMTKAWLDWLQHRL
jgi:hypothetical protein